MPITRPAAFTSEQAFAGDMLTTAVEGDITRWAQIRSYRCDGDPAEVIVAGVDTIAANPRTVRVGDVATALHKGATDALASRLPQLHVPVARPFGGQDLSDGAAP